MGDAETGSDNTLGLFIDFQNARQPDNRGAKQTSLTTKTGLEVTVYKFTQTSDSDGTDIPKDATSLEYSTNSGGKLAKVTYNYQGNPGTEIINKMVETLDIN